MKNLWFASAMLGVLLAAPAHARRPVSVISQRGISQRGISQRGISQRGISQRGISQRGISQRGIAQRPAPAATLAAIDTSQRPAPDAENRWSYRARESRDSGAAAAVRQKAEFRALQRRHRIAASRWYGFSNSRPVAFPTPWLGSYRSAWVSGTGRRPRAWPSTSWRTYYVRSDGSLGR